MSNLDFNIKFDYLDASSLLSAMPLSYSAPTLLIILFMVSARKFMELPLVLEIR
jgi:hypothetical protein